MAQKKIRKSFFSLKIKSSEKQKCAFILFLSKSKILLRLNHGITENWKNCFSMVLKVSTEQRLFNTLEYTKKKGTREFKYLFLKN